MCMHWTVKKIFVWKTCTCIDPEMNGNVSYLQNDYEMHF